MCASLILSYLIAKEERSNSTVFRLSKPSGWIWLEKSFYKSGEKSWYYAVFSPTEIHTFQTRLEKGP